MPSIQSIISRYILTGIFLVAAVTGIIIDEFTKQQFNTQFNNTLKNKAWALATLNDQKHGQVEFEFADEMMPEFESAINTEYFQLWLSNGELLERSHSLIDKDLPFPKIALGDTIFQNIELPNNQPGRLVAIHFTPQIDDDDDDDVAGQKVDIPEGVSQQPLQTVTLVLAMNRTDLINNLALNRRVILLSFLSMLLISYLIIRVAIKRGLSPLRAISDQVQNIDDHSLETELDTNNMHSELSAITVQLNHLFSRLNTAFNREKRFSSNVAHELRTPIAELMTLSDVGKNCINNPEMTEQFFTDTKDIAHNMNQIVETMLTLAKSEMGEVKKNMSVFNLHECIKTSIIRANLNGKESSDVEWDRIGSNYIQVFSDWDKLIQILANLITNAYKYSQPENKVNIESNINGKLLSISISNLTSELLKDDLDHLTDYFWRKDDARTGGKDTGLGLTLVAMLCQILNISLSFELNDNQLFTVTLGNLSVRFYNTDSSEHLYNIEVKGYS